MLISGCGKVVEKTANKIAKDIKKKAKEKLDCDMGSVFNSIPLTYAADYDVKLHRTTFNKVIEDIRTKNDLNAQNFWALLTPSVRDALNFELNLSMITLKAKNPLGVYQSTAYFFEQVRDKFDEKKDYKVRDMTGEVYAFKLRGADTTSMHLFNYKCGRHEKTDLSDIGTAEVLKFEDIVEVYECRSIEKSLKLMEMKNSFYLMGGKEVLYRMPVTDLQKKDKKNSLQISFDSRELSFDLKMKKNQDESIEDFSGKKSEIEFKSSEYAMDEVGSCVSYLGSLQALE